MVGGQERHLVQRVGHHDMIAPGEPGTTLPTTSRMIAGVLPEEVHPAHTGLAGEPRRDHDDVGAGRVRVVVGPDDRGS